MPQTATVAVTLAASNVPAGARARVRVMPASGEMVSVESSPFEGTPAASTATATIALPAGPALLIASVLVDLTLPGTTSLLVDGERVVAIEAIAGASGAPSLRLVTGTGRTVEFESHIQR